MRRWICRIVGAASLIAALAVALVAVRSFFGIDGFLIDATRRGAMTSRAGAILPAQGWVHFVWLTFANDTPATGGLQEERIVCQRNAIPMRDFDNLKKGFSSSWRFGVYMSTSTFGVNGGV